MSFSGANIDGGFNADDDALISAPGVLIVLYAANLTRKLEEVIEAGGKVFRPIYELVSRRKMVPLCGPERKSASDLVGIAS